MSNTTHGDRQVNQPLNAVNTNSTTVGDTIPAVSKGVTTDHSLQGTIKDILWDKVSMLGDTPLEAVTDKKLIGVEGSPLQTLGAVHLEVTFEKQPFTVGFLVVASLITEAMLGHDFLRYNNCVIDVGKSLITFSNVGITLKLNSSAMDSQLAYVNITLSDSLQVPGCSEVEVLATIPEAVSSGTWIVERNTSGRQALLIARTLVNTYVPVKWYLYTCLILDLNLSGLPRALLLLKWRQ